MSQHLRSLLLPELTALMGELDQPAFRARQLYAWLHKPVRTYEEMTNLPRSLRQTLSERYPLTPPEIVRKQVSKLDGTVKYLWRLCDGSCVETVLMRYSYGNTVCVSSEVGCPMGCVFCASTLGGLVRRLEPQEILDQVLFTQLDQGEPVSHVVLMGIGEPLDNFENVLRFLALVNSPEGMGLSMRHISLSTCGLVPKIDALAEKKLQLTLSVSLHAPTDEIRDRIMPVNRVYPLEQLMGACRRYFSATNRRISFEYAMIRGLNDSPDQARQLLALLKGFPAHVNLIPLNRVAESPLVPSTRPAVAAFQELLEAGGVPATVRRTLGGDIDASCGQLRRKYIQEHSI